MTNKSAVISETDYDRLSHLTESPRYRATHAAPLCELRHGLGAGKLVAPAAVPKGVVTMNSRVRVRDVKLDEVETYTLVYPDDADIELGRLSVLAPLGTALLGARAGDVIEFHVPAGMRRLKVERILYQPEASGDYHL